MRRQTIEEYKAVIIGAPQRFSCELLWRAAGQAVVIYRLPKPVRLQHLRLAAGTVSYGYFWEARHYNVYHFVDGNNQTLALYFNISDATRISATQIYWRDLVVDILQTADGRVQVLDQQELPADLPASLRQLILRTRDHLLERLVELRAEIEKRSQYWFSQ